MDVRTYLNDHFLIFDGAMGTMLQKAGMPAGGLPEVYNIKHPDLVQDIHKSYVNAGADVITANTFQANRYKLKDCPYTPRDLILAGIAAAKNSAKEPIPFSISVSKSDDSTIITPYAAPVKSIIAFAIISPEFFFKLSPPFLSFCLFYYTARRSEK